jgi:hypothetical protein
LPLAPRSAYQTPTSLGDAVIEDRSVIDDLELLAGCVIRAATVPYVHLCSWSTPGKAALVGKTWPDKAPLKMTIVYLLVYSKGKEPKAIAVQRRLDF